MPEEIIGCLPEKGWISAETLAAYLNADKKTLEKHIEKLGISRVVIGKWLISIADFEGSQGNEAANIKLTEKQNYPLRESHL